MEYNPSNNFAFVMTPCEVAFKNKKIMTRKWFIVRYQIFKNLQAGGWIVVLNNFQSKKINFPPKKGPKSWVKIGSVTAEIMLIWANVARTYSSPLQLVSVKEGSRNLP